MTRAPAPCTRAGILDEAARIVTQDRNVTHGEPEETFALIAAYWSAHLGVPVTETDVAALMTLFKLARLKANPSNPENWIDGCGYLACGGELAQQARSATERAATAPQAAPTYIEPVQPTPGVYGPEIIDCDDAPVSVTTYGARPPEDRDTWRAFSGRLETLRIDDIRDEVVTVEILDARGNTRRSRS